MNTNTDTSHSTPELFAALSLAQGEIENAAKNAANPHFKSRYADLAEILNTTRPVFAKNGLSLTQFPGYDGALASVTTLIAHKSGGFISAVSSCVPAKSDAQGIGSATTYLRRYSAAAAAGIAQEDDDGNAAAHNGKPRAVATKITDKQYDEIIGLLAACGKSSEGFCAYHGIAEVDELPAAKFDAATKPLRKAAA